MRVLPKGVVAAMAAAILLSGCADEAAEPASPGTGTKASRDKPRAAISLAEARADIRAGLAAGEFEGARFSEMDNREFSACAVTAVVSTAAEPDPRDTEQMADELKQRGWLQTKFSTNGGIQVLSLRKTPWTLDFIGGTGALPEQAQDFTGLSVNAVDRDCANRVAASLSP
ncbi:hypothetical protein ACPCSQ_29840 [Streptomyces griseoincarnatus]|uniref:hypothetical protein n=1 Tax=unclassified Streptomyces TaxID=2593676 RepID=UPI001CD984EA|nr:MULTISPECIES: hypothetical protein [unclassified Streptomyces]MCA2203923.1 hypothetical protein [Streptomyces sp. SMS_SU21]